MIPKTIHYCWFGNLPIPPDQQLLIDQWQKQHPDFRIKCWNESNSPLDNRYCQQALQQQKWANLSNYVRFHALYKEGGIYMDTDMQVIKPLHPLLQHACFLGFEKDEDGIVNNAIMGSIAGHSFIRQCLKTFENTFSGEEQANESAPLLVTRILKEQYSLQTGGTQQLQDVFLFGQEYFYPVHWNETFKLSDYSRHITDNTYTVHLWNKSWLTHDMLNKSISDWQQWAHDLSRDNGRLQELIIQMSSREEHLTAIRQSMETLVADQTAQASTFSESSSATSNAISLLSEQTANGHQSINSLLTDLKATVHAEKQDTRLLLINIQTAISNFDQEMKHKSNLLEILATSNLHYKSLIEQLNRDLQRVNEAMLQREELHLQQIDQITTTLLVLEEKNSLKEAITDHQQTIGWYRSTYEKRSLLGLLKQWVKNKLNQK
ncbi:MAG: glycosyltransferase [Candidatus Pseudobacter hemicellulosilyticus]|uniref:Glycosyltransferase n=1 Tax=Candidatus Pseudobacter hemicellulosilyticus TaxID=3121375 RepID=A0AAJ6BHC3_9BACT|nr:MAG: glycosyltransferase [Pseudobacter sp.]